MLQHSLRWLGARTVIVSAVFCTFASSAGASGTYVLFDPPGSVKTEGIGINTAGNVAGDYDDGGGHGVCFFRRFSDGKIKSFTVDDSPNCAASSINDGGVITGRIVDSADPECVRTGKGFVRAPDGTAESFGYTKSASNYAVALGINKKGNIVGYYRDDSGDSCVFRGFFRDHKTGILTDIPVKGAQDIYATSLNNGDDVTGSFLDFDQVTHGFLKRGTTITSKKCGKGCQSFNIQGADKHNNTGGPWESTAHETSQAISPTLMALIMGLSASQTEPSRSWTIRIRARKAPSLLASMTATRLRDTITMGPVLSVASCLRRECSRTSIARMRVTRSHTA